MHVQQLSLLQLLDVCASARRDMLQKEDLKAYMQAKKNFVTQLEHMKMCYHCNSYSAITLWLNSSKGERVCRLFQKYYYKGIEVCWDNPTFFKTRGFTEAATALQVAFRDVSSHEEYQYYKIMLRDLKKRVEIMAINNQFKVIELNKDIIDQEIYDQIKLWYNETTKKIDKFTESQCNGSYNA
jgi:hypothetical protein